MSERKEIVRYVLWADTEGAIHGFTQTGKAAEKSGKQIEKVGKEARHSIEGVSGLSGAFGSLRSMLGLGAGLGIAGGLLSVAKSTSELGQMTEEFHSITGLGAQASLDYTAALRARGLSTSQAATAFKFLSKNVQTAERQEHSYATSQAKAAAKGKAFTGQLGTQALAFKRLGIDVVQLQKMKPEQQFELIIGRLSTMKDGMEKTRVATQLFGRGGTALMPILDGGALGLKHQYEMAKKFFPTLKGEGVKALEELKVKQAESKMAWEGLEFTLGMKLIPVMTEVMTWFTKVTQEIRAGKGVWGELGKDISGVVGAAKDIVKELEKLGKAFKIPVGAGGLGAALMAFAGIHTIKHPIKAAGTGTKLVKKAGKFLYQHPETAPLVIPAIGATAYGLDVYNSRKELGGHAKGALRMLGGGPSMREVEVALGIVGPGGLAGHGKETGQGKAAGGAMSPAEANEIARIIQNPRLIKPGTKLTPQEIQALERAVERGMSSHSTTIEIDGKKLAAALARNPAAKRLLSEAVSQYAHSKAARR